MNNKKQYSEEWHDKIRPAILLRDNFKCQGCGIKHRTYIFIDQSDKVIQITRQEHEELKLEGQRTYRVFLQVAHKDNDKSNNQPHNLISQCPRCHYKRDKVYKQLLRIGNTAR